MKLTIIFLISITCSILNAQVNTYQHLYTRAHSSYARFTASPSLIELDVSIDLFNELINTYPNKLDNINEKLYLSMCYKIKRNQEQSKLICQDIYKSNKLQEVMAYFDDAERWMLWELLSFHFVKEMDCEAIQIFKDIWNSEDYQYYNAYRAKYPRKGIFCGPNKYMESIKLFAKYKKCLSEHRLAIKYLSYAYLIDNRDILQEKRLISPLLKEWITSTYTKNEIENALDTFKIENIKLYPHHNSSANFSFLDIQIYTRFKDEKIDINKLSETELKRWYFEKLKNSDLLKSD